MTANAADFGFNAVGAFLRAAGLVVLAIGAVLAFVFAFAAALVVGAMVVGAAIAMRVWPRRNASASGKGDTLEAHRTPDGWVVETRAKQN